MASGLTPTYLLPYPLQTDSVDVAGDVESLATAVETELLLKAPLASPVLTGIPEAPTAIADTSTTQIATTQYVVNQGYLKSSTAASDYAPLDSAPLIGTPTAPTAALGTDTTQIATTEYVQNELDNFVTLPNQTGANGKFLTSDGSAASWQNIATSDVTGLDTIINALPDTYSPKNLTVTEKTASYTLILNDQSEIIEMNASTANTLTIPPNSSVAFPIGTQIVIVQSGTGQTTLAAGSGVVLNGTPGLKLRTRWASATIIKRGINAWIAMGDLIA